MRLNSPLRITALGGVLPITGASGSAQLASGSMAERASTLLVEIQREAALLWRHADTLESLARNTQIDWQSHAYHLIRSRSISMPWVGTPQSNK